MRGTVVTVAKLELTRRFRSLTSNTAQQVALAFVAMFGVPLLLGTAGFGFVLGSGLRTGEFGTPVVAAGRLLCYAWLFVVALGGYRVFMQALTPDRLDGMLTTISHRELFGGLLLAEGVLWAVPAAVLAVLGSVAFGIGARSVLAIPLGIVTVGLILASGLSVGAVGALLVRNTSERSRLIARLRLVAIAVIGLAYFYVVMSQQVTAVAAPLVDVLEPTPLGWLGDVALLGTAADASLLRAGGAVIGVGATVAAGLVVAVRLAEWLWYGDGVHLESTATAAEEGWTLEGLVSRPVAGVVLADLKRARRAPITLTYVIYPLIVLASPVMQTIQRGVIPGSLPLLVALCGAWITGALFTLNVLGGQGAVLPTTVLTRDPSRALIRGHAIAGWCVGVPLTVVATVGLGVLSPRPLASVVLLGIVALVLSLAAPLLATGIGAVFPRYEEVSVSRSTTAVVPSLLAFAVYSFLLVILATPALVGNSVLVGMALESALGIDRLHVAVPATVLSSVVVLGASYLSVRYAGRAIETFELS